MSAAADPTDLTCPACGATSCEPIITLDDVPAICNRLYATRQLAATAERDRIDLRICVSCGLAWNTAFDPARVAYEPGYENSLYGSPTFRRYADGLVQHLVSTHDLQDRLVVELGCGDGRFLLDLCARAGARGLGLDPSYSGPAHPAPSVEIRRSETYDTEGTPALIVFRHVLEHVADPGVFLSRVQRLCGPETVIYCEVPNASTMYASAGVWDVIYEHPLYFTAGSLATALRRSGFDVTRSATGHDGQFLCVEALPATGRTGTRPADPGDLEKARAFGTRARQAIDTAQRRLSGWLRKGQKVALWGVGSKGTTFLSLVPAARGLSHLVDVNPAKQGRYPPGASRPISAPSELIADPPDALLVSNPAYRDEIIRSVRSNGIDPQCSVLWSSERLGDTSDSMTALPYGIRPPRTWRT